MRAFVSWESRRNVQSSRARAQEGQSIILSQWHNLPCRGRANSPPSCESAQFRPIPSNLSANTPRNLSRATTIDPRPAGTKQKLTEWNRQYMDKLLFVNLQGNRKVSGTLRGFDIFLNLVLDDTREEGSAEKVQCGTVVR